MESKLRELNTAAFTVVCTLPSMNLTPFFCTLRSVLDPVLQTWAAHIQPYLVVRSHCILKSLLCVCGRSVHLKLDLAI